MSTINNLIREICIYGGFDRPIFLIQRLDCIAKVGFVTGQGTELSLGKIHITREVLRLCFKTAFDQESYDLGT
jgi:hypothetical protein